MTDRLTLHGKKPDGTPLWDAIPAELKAWPHWVPFCFAKRKRNGKLDKIPYSPRTGRKAKVNDPATWGTFGEAVKAYQRNRWNGIGFVFSKDNPYLGIDLDQCRDPQTGVIESWARRIIRRLSSYTEESPSGTGVHIITRGSLPPGGRKHGNVEMYDRDRFFTVTGKHIEGTPLTIAERTDELADLHAEVFGTANGKASANGEQPNGHAEGSDVFSDAEIIQKAMNAANGADFDRLWMGSWSDYPSQSEADLALCSHLAFWTGGDAARIDALFRKSGLCRDKWNERHNANGRTYGEMTIEKALIGAQEFYRPKADNGLDRSDEEENARIIAMERDVVDEALDHPTMEIPKIYPCPDALWRGRFTEVADRLGQRTWEVWAGTLAALGARAHKNIHFCYYGPLYGMVYTLLVNPTGIRKRLCTDTCRALLPEGYTVRDAVQSGPALAPILAEIERDKAGKVQSVTPRPAILVIEEWTTLLKNARIEHSTLADVLNSLFHRTWSWNVSRSDRRGSGGDLVIPSPTLSICATTTESLLKEHVAERIIRSGFLNRYLVLPGTRGRGGFVTRRVLASRLTSCGVFSTTSKIAPGALVQKTCGACTRRTRRKDWRRGAYRSLSRSWSRRRWKPRR